MLVDRIWWRNQAQCWNDPSNQVHCNTNHHHWWIWPIWWVGWWRLWTNSQEVFHQGKQRLLQPTNWEEPNQEFNGHPWCDTSSPSCPATNNKVSSSSSNSRLREKWLFCFVFQIVNPTVGEWKILLFNAVSWFQCVNRTEEMQKCWRINKESITCCIIQLRQMTMVMTMLGTSLPYFLCPIPEISLIINVECSSTIWTSKLY